MTDRAPTEASANRLAAYLLEKGLDGAGPLSGAEDLANEYLIDRSFETVSYTHLTLPTKRIV